MRMNKLSAAVALLVCGISVNAFAGARVVVSGVLPGSIPTQDQGIRSLNSTSAPAPLKKILFQKIVLSADAQDYLAKHISDPTDTPNALFAAPVSGVSSQQIGMNNVPVLDQGQHGTCATFATTAAIDAVLGKTDYVSQLCNLELGAYFESQDANYPSGWEGSTNEIVLNQIKDNGVIKKADQLSSGCRFDGKPEQYNLLDENATGSPVKDTLFKAHSDKVMSSISYTPLFNPEDAFSNKVNMTNALNKVKTAINNGHRIVFGTLIDEKVGGNGLGGSYKARNDTWALTNIIKKHAKNKNNIHAGHAMVITGYDDNAVMTDRDGNREKGILTLRNSWGAQYGDKGNYYMTYDYFKKMVTEAEEIVPKA